MHNPADNRDRIRLRLEQARLAKPAPQPAPQAPNPVPCINELAATGKTLWFGLLSYLAFVGVTLLGVTDADFFLVERKTQLPLINVSIPTLQFFTFAPLLGAVLYIYLHLHLLKLWEAVAFRRHAPEKLGRRPLSDHLSPWLVNDLALSLRADDALHRRPLNTWANAASILLVFIAPLLILGFFWWRSMPVHSGWLTIAASGLPLMASLYVGGVSWFRLRRLANPRHRLRRSQSRALQATWALALIAVSAIGWFRTVEPFGTYYDPIQRAIYAFREREAKGKPDVLARLKDKHSALIKAAWWNDPERFWGDNPMMLASANLTNVVFVETPPGWQDYLAARITYRFKWCQQTGIPFGICGSAPSDEAQVATNLPALRQDWCAENFVDSQSNPDACIAYFIHREEAFRKDWEAERKAALESLPARNLTGFDFRNANLSGAQLQKANLANSQLKGADMTRAHLSGATMSSADVRGSNLSYSDLVFCT